MSKILEHAQNLGILPQRCNITRKKIRAKCPFCEGSRSKAGRDQFDMVINTFDDNFFCFHCKTGGGWAIFEGLLTGRSPEEVIETYRKKPKKESVHPAEKLSKRQLSLIGFYNRFDKKMVKKRDSKYYLRTCEYIWREWDEFISREKYKLFKSLYLYILLGRFEEGIKEIKQKEKELGVSLLRDLLKVFSSEVWPDWALEAKESVDLFRHAFYHSQQSTQSCSKETTQSFTT